MLLYSRFCSPVCISSYQILSCRALQVRMLFSFQPETTKIM